MSLNSPLTLDIVKAELGITDSSLDADITAKIPQAEAKFRQVAGYQFNKVIKTWYESSVSEIKVFQEPNSNVDFLDYGDILLGEDFPDGVYVTQNYRLSDSDVDSDVGMFYGLEMSGAPTADSSTNGSNIVISYNISHYPVLSQIVYYMIGQQDVKKVGEKSVTSKRIGPVSMSYGPGDINQRYGLPNKIVQQIPKYMSAY